MSVPPELLDSRYAKEIWALYEDGELHVESKLTGHFEESTQAADVVAVMEVITAALVEEQEWQARRSEAEL